MILPRKPFLREKKATSQQSTGRACQDADNYSGIVYLCLGLAILVLLATYFTIPSPTGMVTAGERQRSQDINLSINTSTLLPYGFEDLQSIRLSGRIIGDGKVKIYAIEDRNGTNVRHTILDSSELRSKKSDVGLITGMATGSRIDQDTYEERPRNTGNQSISQNTTKQNTTLVQHNQSNTTNVNRSQETPNPNQDLAINQTNQTPDNNTEQNEGPEDDTFETEEQNNEQSIEFSEHCQETCFLGEINTEMIVVELEGVVLELDSMTYVQNIRNSPPEQIQEIEDIEFYESYELDTLKYFGDRNEEDLTYKLKEQPYVRMKQQETLLEFTHTGFPGKYELFLYVSDGQNEIRSRPFNVTVMNDTQNLTIHAQPKKQVRVGERITWEQWIFPKENESKATFTTYKGAESVEVSGKRYNIEKIREKNDVEEYEFYHDGDETEYLVRWKTQGPTQEEESLSPNRKRVTVSSELPYTNVLASTGIAPAKEESIRLYWLRPQKTEHEITNYIDEDGDGLIEAIEWVVPHLSEQVFEIIIITQAEHLDENREFIQEVYDYVKEQDGNWSPTITDREYLRVRFEKNLTSANDITVYARPSGESGSLKVYSENGSTVLAEFPEITQEGLYKEYLTGMTGSADVFDLRVSEGLEFDYVVDPQPVVVEFMDPTLDNDTTTSNTSIEVKVWDSGYKLKQFVFEWNDTNYSVYNETLIMKLQFDNKTFIGENYLGNGSVWDSGLYNHTAVYEHNNTNIGTLSKWNSTGKYYGALEFDGVDDFVNVTDEDGILDFNKDYPYTWSQWIKIRGFPDDYQCFIAKDFCVGKCAGFNHCLYQNGEAADVVICDGGATGSWQCSPNLSLHIPIDEWIHLAITYNGSSGWDVYVNGTLQGNLTFSPKNDMSAPYYIGAGVDVTSTTGNPKYFFNGSIDEVVVWNKTLNADEIQHLYFGNLNLYSDSNAYFYINKSKNTTHGLADGTYTYEGWLYNGASWLNTSERVVHINTSNNAPTTLSANITPSSPIESDDLLGYCNASDGDGDNVTYYWQWYRNESLYSSGHKYNPDNISKTGDDSEIGVVTSPSLTDPENSYDNDWDTEATGSSGVHYLMSNYSIPDNVEDAVLEVKTQGTTDFGSPVYPYYQCYNYSSSSDITFATSPDTGVYRENVTIPADCLDSDIAQLSVYIFSGVGGTQGQIYDVKLWYNSSTGNFPSGQSVNVANISSSDTVVSENWTLSCLANDGTSNSSWLNSSTVDISSGAVAPVVLSANITPSSPIESDDLLGYCNASDGDGDNVTYYWQWYRNDTVYSNGTFANDNIISTIEDATEDGNATGGSKVVDPDNAFDDSYDTYSSTDDGDDAQYYLNYTVPSQVQNAYWEYKVGTIGDGSARGYCYNYTDGSWQSGLDKLWDCVAGNCRENITVSEDCLSGEYLQVKILLNGGLPTGFGGDGIDAEFYEEQVWWNVSNGTFNESVQVNVANISSSDTVVGENWTLSCLANDGTSNSSWLNSSTVDITSATVNRTLYTPADSTTAAYTITGSVSGAMSNQSNSTVDEVLNFTHATWGNRVLLTALFGSEDVDLTNMTIEVDATRTAINVSNVSGIEANHTILVPNVSGEGVYVCPLAQNLSGVVPSCTGIVRFSDYEAGQGTWKGGVHISVDGGLYKITNLTSSGGGDDGMSPRLRYETPTPDNDTSTTNTSFEVNVSINESNLEEIVYEWNGTNYSLYNDSLVLMMNFDNISALGENDANVVDVSKGGHDGTVVGPTLNLTDCKSGKCYTFEDNYIELPASNTILTDSPFTISAWIRTDVRQGAYGTEGRIVNLHREDEGSWSTGAAIYAGGDTGGAGDDADKDNICFLYATADGGSHSWLCQQPSTDYHDGNYHMISAIHNGSTATIYYDGVELVSENNDYGNFGTAKAQIGTYDQSSRYFNGNIDEVRIWNRTLNADEIQQQYMTNLRKYDTDKWSLYVNQSKNATDGLDLGSYTYRVFATDNNSQTNQTGLRTITITEADTWSGNNVTDCMNITASGDYALANEINPSSTNFSSYCINISANNVTLDCNGYAIRGDLTEDYGIYVYRDSEETTNVTIKGCQVSDWDTAGVFLRNANSNLVYNNAVSNNSDYGIRLYNADYVNITNNTANNNTYGITIADMGSASENGKVYNNTALNNTAHDLRLRGNVVSYCNVDIQDFTGTGNKPIVYYNSAAVIENWTNNVSGIILCNADSSKINNLTLHNDFQANGLVIGTRTENVNITNSLINNTYQGIPFEFYTDNNRIVNVTISNTADDGIAMSYADDNYFWGVHIEDAGADGIYLGGSRNNFTNITFVSNNQGMRMGDSWNRLTTSRFLDNSNIGLWVDGCDNCTIANNTINNSGTDGIRVRYSGDTIFTQNNITASGGNGIYMLTGGSEGGVSFYNNLINNSNNWDWSNTLYNNTWNTTNQTGTRIYGDGPNIGGNFWASYDSPGSGFSEACDDVGNDGFCDKYYSLYNDSTCSNDCSNNTDYLALSDEYVGGNNAPVIDSVNLTPTSPNASSILNCSYAVNDADAGDTILVMYAWWNGTTQLFNSTDSWVGSGSNYTLLGANYTLDREKWNCSVNVSDGTDYTTISYSTTVNISRIPAIEFEHRTPASGTSTTNNSFEINISLNESYLETLMYEWNGANYSLYNDSLVLMMNFDNLSSLGESSTVVVDVGAEGHNGTWTGGQDSDSGWNCTESISGCSLMFDGNGDYVSTEDMLDAATQATFMAWIKLNTSELGGDSDFFTKGAHTVNQPLLIWRDADVGSGDQQDNVNAISAFIYDGSDVKWISSPSNSLNDVNWHHLTVTFKAEDEEGLKIFLDGVLQQTGNTSDVNFIEDTADPLRMGADSSGGGQPLGGYMDEIKVWNTTLTESEVQLHYMLSLRKYDTDKWSLYVNQSKNATDGLDTGSYTYQAFAEDEQGLTNNTEERTITITSPTPGTAVWDCKDINESGEYYMNASITNESANFKSYCINITAENVTFDCKGYTIEGNDTADYGIYSYPSSQQYMNTTIKNCNVSDWDGGGIYLRNSDNNTVLNTILYSNGQGIALWSSDYSNLTNITARNTGTIFGITGAQFVTMQDVIAVGSNYGISMSWSAQGLQVINSNISDNNFDVSVSATTCDSEGSETIAFINVTGTKDRPIVWINESRTIQGWDSNFSEIIFCDADYSVMDDVNFNTMGQTNTIYIVSTDYSNFTNIEIANVRDAMRLRNSDNNIFANITAKSCVGGIATDDSDSNNFTNITSVDHNYAGLAIIGNNNYVDGGNSSDNTASSGRGIAVNGVNNTIKNVIMTGNDVGLKIDDGSGNNTLSNLTITASVDYGIELEDAGQEWPSMIYNSFFNNTINIKFTGIVYNNTWNTSNQTGTRVFGSGTNIGGNFWANYSSPGDGFSEYCPDVGGDGFCDAYYNILNNSNCSNDCSNNTDYLALSDEYIAPPGTGPTISYVEANPDPQGFGQLVRINASITPNNGVVTAAYIEIDPPGTPAAVNYSMTNYTATNWDYNYTEYYNGSYAYKIWANDSDAWSNTTTNYFDMYLNITLQLKTLEDSYLKNEIVNLTDPPDIPPVTPKSRFESSDNFGSAKVGDTQEGLAEADKKEASAIIPQTQGLLAETKEFILSIRDRVFGHFLANHRDEEPSISILNPQSYPNLYSNWTVQFSTTGTADLHIRPINSTSWEDLEFLQILCGDDLIDYEMSDLQVIVSEYSCDETSSETVRVLTSGEHHLEFLFGESKAYAHNTAGDEDTTNWNLSFDGNSQNDYAYGVAVDSDDNVIVVGSGYDLISGFSGSDWWLKKFSGDGVEDAENWNLSFDGSGVHDYANAVTVDSDDNVIVVGSGTNLISGSSGYDWWLKKFSSDGVEDAENWNLSFDGSGSSDVAYGVAVDSDDNVYVVGYGYDLISDSSGQDWWLKKFSADGVEDTENWNKTMGDDGLADHAQSVAVDSEDNVYVAGVRARLVMPFAQDREGWIKKFSADGVEDAENWNLSFDEGYDMLYSITTDSNDNVYAAGLNDYSSWMMEIESEWLIVKLDSDGLEDTENWNKTYGENDEYEYVVGMATDSENNVYAAGRGFNLISGSSNQDWWIKKFEGEPLLGATYSEFENSARTTNLSSLGLGEVNVSLCLDDSNDGMICWDSNITLNNTWDLDSVVEIAPNYVWVNSTTYPDLAGTANITLWRGYYRNLNIYKDGVFCSECEVIENNGTGVLTFNISGFSNITWEEKYQSKAMNNATLNASFFLLMKVQYYNATDELWYDELPVVNETTSINLNNGSQLKLDQYWNGKINTSSNLTHGSGWYRVYAALVDNRSAPLMNLSGDYLNVTYNFSYTNNSIPVTSGPWVAPAAPTTLQDLVMTGSCQDDDISDSLTLTYTWYKDGVNTSSGSTAVSSGVNTSLNTLDSASTSRDETWVASISCKDANNDTAYVNSSAVTIQNSNPSLNSVNLTPHGATTFQDLNCSYSINDLDATDDIYITYIWYNGSDEFLNTTDQFANPGSNWTNLSYHYTSIGDTWNCSVNASDGTVWTIAKYGAVNITGNNSVSVNDSSDQNTVYANHSVIYANYSDIFGAPVTIGECKLYQNRSGRYVWHANLVYNSSTFLYEVIADGSNASGHCEYMPVGTYTLNVTCDNVSALDSITISNYSTTLTVKNSTDSPSTGQTVSFYAYYNASDRVSGIGFTESGIGRVIWNINDLYAGGTSGGVRFLDYSSDGKLDSLVMNNPNWGYDVYLYDFDGTEITDGDWPLDQNGQFGPVHTTALHSDLEQNDVITVFSGVIEIRDTTGSVSWQSTDVGSVARLTFGDFDCDGLKDDFTWSAYNSTSTEHLIYVYTESEGSWSQSWQRTVAYSANSWTNETAALAVGDIDQDGCDDVVVGSDDNWMWILNSSNGHDIFNISRTGGYHSLEVVDFDNDGQVDDIVAGTNQRIYVYRYNGSESVTYAASDAFVEDIISGGNAIHLAVVDLDADGYYEVVSDSSGSWDGPYGYLHATNINNDTIWTQFIYSDSDGYQYCNDLEAVDVDGDSDYEIFCTDSDFDVLNMYDHTGDFKWNFSSSTDRLLEIADINGDGITDLVVNTPGNIDIHVIQEVGCIAGFNDSESYNMTWNNRNRRWEINRSFPSSGIYEYNVTCSKGGYEDQIFSSKINLTKSTPSIENVQSISSQNPTEATTTNVTIAFNVSDADGVSDLNDSSASIAFNKSGVSREGSCTPWDLDSITVQYNCSVLMQYYDEAGTWAINFSIQDNDGSEAHNDSESMTYNELLAITINLSSLDYGSLDVGSEDERANPVGINNTGNMNITKINLTGYDLKGNESAGWIGVGNFSVNTSDSAEGQMLQNDSITLENATLDPHTDQGFTLQTLFIYLDVPLGLLPEGYESSEEWIINVE